MYAKAEQKIVAAAKRKKDSSKDKELLARFKGAYPPSLLKVMSGEGTAEDLGFHQIAMQIAITTNALGKKEPEMLAACEGLVANHVSDGSRYNSPAKRKTELSRMFHYTNDNICYTYSKDAVRKLAPSGSDTTNLDGLTEASGALLSGGADGEGNDDEEGYLSGVFITEGGIYRKTEDGAPGPSWDVYGRDLDVQRCQINGINNHEIDNTVLERVTCADHPNRTGLGGRFVPETTIGTQIS